MYKINYCCSLRGKTILNGGFKIMFSAGVFTSHAKKSYVAPDRYRSDRGRRLYMVNGAVAQRQYRHHRQASLPMMTAGPHDSWLVDGFHGSIIVLRIWYVHIYSHIINHCLYCYIDLLLLFNRRCWFLIIVTDGGTNRVEWCFRYGERQKRPAEWS